MSTWVAFLRAINLGATRRFPKDDIVAATEAAGFRDVATHINTGNVRVVTSRRSRARLEAALERAYAERTGFEVPTIAFTAAELREVVAVADRLDHTGLHSVSLLKHDPGPDAVAAQAALAERAGPGERVHVEGRAVHLLLGSSVQGARLGNAPVDKLLGCSTNRNVTVLRAVVQKWCS